MIIITLCQWAIQVLCKAFFWKLDSHTHLRNANNIAHYTFSPSHLEGSSTSVGRPGHCQSPVLAVENVDVRQRILFDVPPDGVHVS